MAATAAAVAVAGMGAAGMAGAATKGLPTGTNCKERSDWNGMRQPPHNKPC